MTQDKLPVFDGDSGAIDLLGHAATEQEALALPDVQNAADALGVTPRAIRGPVHGNGYNVADAWIILLEAE